MNPTTVSIIVSGLAFVLALIAVIKVSRNTVTTQPAENYESTRLRLQAYERLVLLTERIALPNLISRLNQQGVSAIEMKMALVENIRQEFDYNSTQQLYVSQVSWDAVRNLKEQNIMVVNQVAASLPPEASGTDLNKKILEVIMSQPNGALHDLVLEGLNFEAKKIMK